MNHEAVSQLFFDEPREAPSGPLFRERSAHAMIAGGDIDAITTATAACRRRTITSAYAKDASPSISCRARGLQVRCRASARRSPAGVVRGRLSGSIRRQIDPASAVEEAVEDRGRARKTPCRPSSTGVPALGEDRWRIASRGAQRGYRGEVRIEERRIVVARI